MQIVFVTMAGASFKFLRKFALYCTDSENYVLFLDSQYGVHYYSKHFEHIFDFLTPFSRPKLGWDKASKRKQSSSPGINPFVYFVPLSQKRIVCRRKDDYMALRK